MFVLRTSSSHFSNRAEAASSNCVFFSSKRDTSDVTRSERFINEWLMWSCSEISVAFSCRFSSKVALYCASCSSPSLFSDCSDALRLTTSS